MWKSGKRKSRPPELPSAGELLAYLDGQLPRARRREVQALLENSWELRSQLADIERDTKHYIDACTDEPTGPFPSPDNIWAAVRAKHREHSAAHTRSPRFPGRWLFRGGLAAAAAALLVAIFVMTRSEAIAASTILDRGRSTEATLLRTRSTPVVHQRLEVSKRGKKASWQIWSAPTKGRYAESVGGDDAAVRELKIIRAKNKMDPRRPLSAEAYGDWRRSANIRSESVTPDRTEGGESGYRIDLTLASSGTPDGILASSLLVRGSDWRPVSERLTVQEGDHEERFEIREIGYEVMAFEQLPASVFAAEAAASPAPASLTPNSLPPPAVSPSPAQLLSLEIKARYALHRMHACWGEPIEVDTFADGVRVRGMVDTEDRRRELTQALANLDEPFLSVTLHASQQGAPAGLTSLEGFPVTSAGSPLSQDEAALPVEALLPRGANGERVVAQETVVKLSNEAIQSGRALLMEAWAVRRLLDRYPGLPSAGGADNRWLVEAMVRDHLVSFEQDRDRASEIVHFLQPSLAPSESLDAPAGAPQALSHTLVEKATQVNSMVLSLFARGHNAGGPEALQLLANRLAELKELSGRLQAAFGG